LSFIFHSVFSTACGDCFAQLPPPLPLGGDNQPNLSPKKSSFMAVHFFTLYLSFVFHSVLSTQHFFYRIRVTLQQNLLLPQ
jgi:hypothetical protein